MAIPVRFRLRATAMIISLLCSTSVYSQTLKQAIDQTLKTNPDILIDVEHHHSIDEAVKGARGGYYPKVQLGLGIGRENSDNATTRALVPPVDSLTLTRKEASLTLTQMLFDGFATPSEVARNEARSASAAFKAAGTSEQIGLRAVEAYLEVLRFAEIVNLTKENLQVHERTYDQIKVRSDSGMGRKADLDQIAARLGLAKSNLFSAEANLRDAEINFRRIVGSPPASLVRPDTPDLCMFPKTLEEALRIALENHPILKSANADVDAAIAQNKTAKSTLSPRVDLQLGLNNNRNIDGVAGRADSRTIMFFLRYNLFNGGSDDAHVRETSQLTVEAKEIMRRTHEQIEQSTRLSWNAIYSALDRLPSLKEFADSSTLTRDAYFKQFGIGQRTLLDMLDAENERFTAATDYVNADYLETFSRFRLLADMGRLIKYFNETASCKTEIAAPAATQQQSYIALIKSPDGGTGALDVVGAKGTASITQSGQGATLDGGSKPFDVSEEKINKDFGAALTAQPALPKSYLINFENGSVVLTAASKKTFDDIVADLKGRSAADISIAGHTDTVGSDAFNEKLGLKRAKQVAAELTKHGFKPVGQDLMSYGEKDLLVKTPDNTPEPRNRRVEVTVR